MSLVENERTKLTATFMNGIAIAMVAAGAIAPLVAFSYGLPGAAHGVTIALIGIGWISGGIALHLVARRHLKGLAP
ncbi:MAG: amino acid transporter [Alphaproteobacteria bacterium]